MALAPAPFGGLESVVAALAPGLVERGVGTTCVVSLDPEAPSPHPLSRRLEDAGVGVRELRIGARAYRQEFAAIAAAARETRATVVHTHGYRSDLLGGLAARRLGLPWVSTAHGFTGGSRRNRAYEWLQRRAWRRADAVIAVSEPLAERIAASGVSPGRIVRVPNAFRACTDPYPRDEARRLLGLPADGVLAAWIGRLTHEKAPQLFARALALSAAAGVTGVLLGEGPERAAVEALGAGTPLRCRLLGAVPEAARYLAAFDLLVLSSRTEGTPMVVLEAMHARVPVVATAVGGVPALLDGGAGWLVPPDDPAALAGAMQQAAADPAEAARRAAVAAGRVASRYALGPWIERHLALYTSLGAPERS